MNMLFSLRNYTYLCWVVTTIFFQVGSMAQSARSDARPNIIYIYADDMGYGELGCYGQKYIKTPHLDQLAAEGMRFTQHYTSAPVCAPARCMLLTGKHGGHSYIRGNYELGGFEDSTEGGQMPLPEGIFTLPGMLKNAGYATALVGKWGLGMAGTSGSPLKHGFDYYYGYLDQKQAHNYYPTHLWENDHWDTLNNPVIKVHQALDPATATAKDFEKFTGNDYAPAMLTKKALQFIDRHRSAPFFLYLPYTIPHVSLQAPKEYIDKYKGQFNEKPYYGKKGYSSTLYPLSTYAAMITYLDDQVGIIMQKLKEAGLDRNTIVFFSSDNGASFAGGADPAFFNSVAGLRGLKMELYEGGIRMPFIARWPGHIKAGAETDLVSIQYDMLATLADLTGQQTNQTDGISFLPTLKGQKQSRIHDFLYFEYPENGGQVAIRMGDWKAVKRNLKKLPNSPWELYDLKKDPQEKNDVSALYPAVIDHMNSLLKSEHQHSHIRDWEFVDPRFTGN